MSGEKKYIVVWTTQRTIRRDKPTVYKDHYETFIDGTSVENLTKATEVYQKKLQRDNLYTASLCEIIQSTDY